MKTRVVFCLAFLGLSASATFRLPQLAGGGYVFENLDTGKRTLQGDRLDVTLSEPRSSAIYVYSPDR